MPGTPTNSAIDACMNQRKVPHLFLATGAVKWGSPQEFPWTRGWQPAYRKEAAIFARFLLPNRPDAASACSARTTIAARTT